MKKIIIFICLFCFAANNLIVAQQTVVADVANTSANATNSESKTAEQKSQNKVLDKINSLNDSILAVKEKIDVVFQKASTFVNLSLEMADILQCGYQTIDMLSNIQNDILNAKFLTPLEVSNIIGQISNEVDNIQKNCRSAQKISGALGESKSGRMNDGERIELLRDLLREIKKNMSSMQRIYKQAMQTNSLRASSFLKERMTVEILTY